MPSGVYVRTPEHIEINRQSKIKHFKEHPGARENIRKSRIKSYQEHPEIKEKQSQSQIIAQTYRRRCENLEKLEKKLNAILYN